MNANTKVVGLDRFLGKVAKFPANVTLANRVGVEAAALAVKTAVLAELGGVTRLSGVGRKGAKIGVRYDVRGAANPTALVRATGPFHLIERDTKPHTIPKRRGKSNRLRLGDRWVTGPIQHPGTRGKHPWARGTAFARSITREVYGRAHARMLRRLFGGA